MANNVSFRRVIALAMIGGGLWLAMYPFVSLWRVSGEVLEMLPEGAISSPDDRQPLAMFDSEFVLATRTYSDTTPAQVVASLRDAGFESQYQSDGHQWFWRTCCGSYDAALVRVEAELRADDTIEAEENAVRVVATVFDDDSQAVWAMFAVVGAAVIASGVLLALWPKGSTTEVDHEDLVSAA